jgi:hypothetical protein
MPNRSLPPDQALPGRIARDAAAGSRLAAVALLAAWAVVGSCDTLPTEPRFPADAVPLAVPDRYAVWWEVTEQCSGLSGRFADVHWYVIPNVTSFTVDREQYNGYWWLSGNRIVLAGGSILDGTLVRHEMLHALIKHDGHPRRYFVEQCGGVVICIEECRSEAGAPPASSPTAPIVGADHLVVRTFVAPQTVPGGDALTRGQWLSVTVSATNASAEPVRVRIARTDGTLGRSFGFRLAPLTGEGDPIVREMFPRDTLVGFGVGRTRRYVFDVQVNVPGGPQLAPGAYRVTGWYNTAAGSAAMFTVTP